VATLKNQKGSVQMNHQLKNFLISSFLITTLFIPFASTPVQADPIHIKILGINDFHGQVSTGRRMNNRPVGSAAVMASYLKQAKLGMSDSALIALMGDQVGASPPASGLLKDEPTIMFFNTLANKFCGEQTRMDPQCNMVATVGNHEFDKGQKSMHEIMYGRETPPTDSWLDLPHYPGAYFPYISANIVDANSGKLLFPPYVIKKINGVPIAFIGAILKDAPDVILPTSIEGVKFLDEADAINSFIPEIKAQGVHTIIVLIHQGGNQASYEGPTKENTKVEGPIVDVVKRLDDSVDVVMAGHTHQFINAFLENQNGKKILVTQANSYSASFAEVDLAIDPKSLSVVNESAKIVTTYSDQFPGDKPDPEVEKLMKQADAKTAPIINSYIATTQTDLLRATNEAGESNMGDLIADSYRAAMHTDMAFFNPGSMRADIYAGKITWGNFYAVQPFSNFAVKMTMTGADIYDLFEQQWRPTETIMLPFSGLKYTYDLKQPIGHRVVAMYHDGQLLQKDKTYTVTTNNFFAFGGDAFTVMRRGKIVETGATDLEALIAYVKSLPQPFSIEVDGRVQKVK
jgi:5'-nucleotidase